MSKVKRTVLEIDKDLCDGCGLCVPSCAEGAIKVINGKAKLVSETLCDGLGACIGVCPKGALRLVEREAEPFEESHVSNPVEEVKCECEEVSFGSLSNWPIQLRLVSPHAPYLKGQSLVISSDCVAYAYPGFHKKVLNGKKLVIGCPKLDPANQYVEKLSEIISSARPRDITLAIMEIPCCRAFLFLLRSALQRNEIDLPVKAITISTEGKILKEELLHKLED